MNKVLTIALMSFWGIVWTVFFLRQDCFGQLPVKPGNCVSYTLSGNTVIFNGENGSKVSVKICGKEVVKLWYAPAGNFKRNNESFAVVKEDLEELGPLKVDERASYYEIFTGKLRVRVNKYPFGLRIFDQYRKELLSDFKDLGLIKDSAKLISYKSLRADEQFLGLGEKAGPLNRRGRAYKMWNSDKPCYSTEEDPLYKSIPFFMSSYHYGIFFDNTFKSEFKFGTESNEYYSFESKGGELIYYFIAGNDYKDIIEQYMHLTGNPIMPPKWALGFSQCRGLYTKEAQARNIASEFRKRRIPCDIIYQDIGWVDGLQNFEWKRSSYPDPKGMLNYLDSLGFKMIVSQDPVISRSTKAQWREADSLHYFTTDIRTGKSYDMPWPWGGNCGVVDFTKPGVSDWWGNYQQKPLNDGVRGFWTDMGEPAWSNEDSSDRRYMKHYAGMHEEIHNVYGLTWDKVVKEQFEKHNPDKRIFQMTRAAYAGLQRYAFGWSGDSGNGDNVLEGWDKLAGQIPVGLSAGMGLLPFWACDISGYCGDIKDYPAMSELYVRWMQFGVFNPLSRAHHEGDNAAEPWQFGKEAEEYCRAAIQLKYRLFPYIYTYAREAYDKGLPLMRALVLEYPDDPEMFKVDGEFLFGKELLVAPVVKKGATTRKLYLPEGEWIDFNDGRTHYKGGQWISCPAPLSLTPLFVKQGSIIPMMPVMEYIHEKKTYPVFLHIYPATKGKQACFELYEDDGESLGYQKNMYSKTKFTAVTLDSSYQVTVSARGIRGGLTIGQRNLVLQFHLAGRPKSAITGRRSIRFLGREQFLTSVDAEFTTSYWTWDEKAGICSVKLPDTGKETDIRIWR